MAALSGQASGRSGRTLRLGLQMADFILSRTSSLSARPSHFYHVDLGCGWPISYRPVYGVYQRPSRAIFLSRARFIKAGQLQWPFCQQCGRSGRLIAKWPDLHIRALRGRFHIVPYKEFISGQAKPFYQGLAKRIATLSTPAAAFYQSRRPSYQANGRSIKPVAILSRLSKPNGKFSKPMAVLSRNCQTGQVFRFMQRVANLI